MQLLELVDFRGERNKNKETSLKNISRIIKSVRPKCSVPIEKTGGCNHMTCSKCYYEFCWLCSAEYSFAHFCGREKSRGHRQQPRRYGVPRLDLDYVLGDNLLAWLWQQRTDEAFSMHRDTLIQQYRELERFAHYYNRFVIHGQGQRYAENQCGCSWVDRANTFSQVTDVQSGADTEFF
jgi:hypothetical protein